MEDWIKKKIGLDKTQRLTREAISDYQVKKLKETITIAKENSPFYRKHLKGVEPEHIESISDIQTIPFLEAEDIRANGMKMLCRSGRNNKDCDSQHIEYHRKAKKDILYSR